MKEFLSQKGVQYKEYDVSHDPAAANEMVRLSNQRGVPVTVVDGTVVVGFDRQRLEQLVGQSRKPHLGAAVTDAANMPAEKSGGLREGAFVGRVRAGSPAAQAGLHAGDIITAVAGHSVRSAYDLENIVARIPAGQAVEVRYQRDHQQQTITIKF